MTEKQSKRLLEGLLFGPGLLTFFLFAFPVIYFSINIENNNYDGGWKLADVEIIQRNHRMPNSLYNGVNHDKDYYSFDIQYLGNKGEIQVQKETWDKEKSGNIFPYAIRYGKNSGKLMFANIVNIDAIKRQLASSENNPVQSVNPELNYSGK